MKKKAKKEIPLLDIPTPVVPIIDPPVPNRAWTEMKVRQEAEVKNKREGAREEKGQQSGEDSFG